MIFVEEEERTIVYEELFQRKLLIFMILLFLDSIIKD